MFGRVQCYFNLHKKVWSIRSKDTGKVVAHSTRVDLRNCKFKVGQAGMERVRAEERKNVHAWVEGDLVNVDGGTLTEHGAELGYDVFFDAPWTISTQMGQPQITYNPYKYTSFVDVDTGEPVYEYEAVTMRNKKVYYGHDWKARHERKRNA